MKVAWREMASWVVPEAWLGPMSAAAYRVNRRHLLRRLAANAPLLIRELLAKGRRVFLVTDAFPRDMLDQVILNLRVRPLASSGLPMAELSLP